MKNCGFSAFIGSYFLATLLVGEIYDRNAAMEHDGGKTCTGTRCFSTSMIVLAAMNVVSVICAIALTLMSRQIYAAKKMQCSRASRR